MQAALASPETAAPPFSAALSRFRVGIESEIAGHLAGKRRAALEAAPEAAALVDSLADLMLAGGKRLRPALVHHAYLACGGPSPEEARTLELAAEYLHTYLLIHDDVMDHAEVRRGRPSVHAVFRERHRRSGWRGEAQDHGRSMAILVGDLAASYAFELAGEAAGAGHPQVGTCFAAMAQEVIYGQYLEVLVSFADDPREEDLRRVLQLKSGRYSIERPLELGALLARGSGAQLAVLSTYGQALGEAFQLRDDLLGVFGEAEAIGKPVGADLAEGKFTFLVFHALAAASPVDRAWLRAARGNPAIGSAEAARLRSLLAETGAAERVRDMVGERVALARRSLAAVPFAPEGREFLEGLIAYSEERDR